MKIKKKLFYIAEINLPSFRAYTIHVLKIIDAFTNTLKTQLIIPFCSQNYNYKNIKKDFLLTSKKQFQIKNIFNQIFNQILRESSNKMRIIR